jgi:hypothetical protein
VAAAALALLPLALCLYSRACGPFFPNSVLRDGDGLGRQGPMADFVQEVKRLSPRPQRVYKAVRPKDSSSTEAARTTEAELADLAAALKQDRTPDDRAKKIIEEYTVARLAIGEFQDKLSAWRSQAEDANDRGEAPRLRNVRIPDDLPVGFGKYLEGAVLYHQGKMDQARAAWQGVVDVGSPHRAVWAAYMIARSYAKSDPNKAIELFPRVRQLVDKGLEDSLGLACESLGQEARVNLDLCRYDRAVELYYQQFAGGDPTAVWSLRDTAAKAFDADDKTLAALAKSDQVRPVMAAYILARGGRFGGDPFDDANGVNRWLSAVEKAGVSGAREADRFAWAAYQAGDANAAQRWVDRAPADAAIANWVRGKLLLREGKLDAAAQKLALAVRALPRSDPNEAEPAGWKDLSTYPWEPRTEGPAEWAAGELAVLKLSRSQYAEALDLLLKYGWWEDAAYVAERVLTTAELRAYVDKNWPERPTPASGPAGAATAGYRVPALLVRPENWAPAVSDRRIRHLLARRLAREGQVSAARPYLPEDLRPQMKDYEESLTAARDANGPQDARVNAFLKAARIARWKGMDLLSTECAPDWHLHDGQYEEDDFTARTDANLAMASADGNDDSAARPNPLAPVTDDERKRAARSLPQPNERFHYRYVAAELMWQAAALMPDGNDRTAYVLCEGGTWLKVRDPNAALRFYRSLVLRCGDTYLGSYAKLSHWFPPLPKAPVPVPASPRRGRIVQPATTSRPSDGPP